MSSRALNKWVSLRLDSQLGSRGNTTGVCLRNSCPLDASRLISPQRGELVTSPHPSWVVQLASPFLAERLGRASSPVPSKLTGREKTRRRKPKPQEQGNRLRTRHSWTLLTLHCRGSLRRGGLGLTSQPLKTKDNPFARNVLRTHCKASSGASSTNRMTWKMECSSLPCTPP